MGPDDYHSPVRAAALGALSIVLLGCAACTANTSPAASVSSGAASSGRTDPIVSPPPVTPPTPPGTNLPAFACADASGGTAATAGVTFVRVGEQPGYDRFVIQFDSQVPKYTVKRLSKPVFTQGASGQPITLSGTAGVSVVLHSASQSASYTGSTDFTQGGFAVLKEARLTQDFEGTVSWGLGLGSPACMRVFTLVQPSRLVIDFQTPATPSPS